MPYGNGYGKARVLVMIFPSIVIRRSFGLLLNIGGILSKLTISFDRILPEEKDFPLKTFNKWDVAVTDYFNITLRKFLTNDFEDTVENWKHKPKFKATYSEPYDTRKQLVVEPFGRYTLNWSRVSEGTRSRSIFPRPGHTHMTFQPFYTPRTRPGGPMFWGGPGANSGPVVRATQVNNHSIKARKFTEEIAKKEKERIQADLKRLTDRILK